MIRDSEDKPALRAENPRHFMQKVRDTQHVLHRTVAKHSIECVGGKGQLLCIPGNHVYVGTFALSLLKSSDVDVETRVDHTLPKNHARYTPFTAAQVQYAPGNDLAGVSSNRLKFDYAP